MIMLTNKDYKYRIYPNSTQRNMLNSFFGDCRKVYNYFLDERIRSYKEDGISLTIE